MITRPLRVSPLTARAAITATCASGTRSENFSMFRGARVGVIGRRIAARRSGPETAARKPLGSFSMPSADCDRQRRLADFQPGVDDGGGVAVEPDFLPVEGRQQIDLARDDAGIEIVERELRMEIVGGAGVDSIGQNNRGNALAPAGDADAGGHREAFAVLGELKVEVAEEPCDAERVILDHHAGVADPQQFQMGERRPRADRPRRRRERLDDVHERIFFGIFGGFLPAPPAFPRRARD